LNKFVNNGIIKKMAYRWKGNKREKVKKQSNRRNKAYQKRKRLKPNQSIEGSSDPCGGDSGAGDIDSGIPPPSSA